jgi:hypothetical protein
MAFLRSSGVARRLFAGGPAVVPADEPVVQSVTVSARGSKDQCSFAETKSSSLLQTGNGGLTWQVNPECAECGVGALAWTAGAKLTSLIAIASGRDLLWSADDGRTWHPRATPAGDMATVRAGTEGEASILLIGQHEQGTMRFC